ncbi:MAG: rhomboid family intramembrane serine protease [Clostridiales bacterium]|nr:rhomboid family intramembrane serine protease [Clostridiales bacterium]
MSGKNAWQPFRGFSINTKKPAVTWGFILVCVAVYGIDIVTSYWLQGTWSLGVLSWYGMRINPLITAGQWWRLITPVFLHGSVSHLLFNCLALYIWGRYVEALYGRAKYAGILFMAGFSGCVLGYAFSANNSLGASGAVFGLFGAILAFRKYDKRLFNFIFGMQTLLYVGINLAMGFFQPYIDILGHVGGLVGGYLAGRTLGMLIEKRMTPGRALAGVTYAVLNAACIALGYFR